MHDLLVASVSGPIDIGLRCVVMTHCKRSDPNRRAVKPGKWLRLEAVRVSRPVTLLLYEHSMGIG